MTWVANPENAVSHGALSGQATPMAAVRVSRMRRATCGEPLLLLQGGQDHLRRDAARDLHPVQELGEGRIVPPLEGAADEVAGLG